ncbi:MAG: RNase adapter RapZ [Dongiaceae bacterium]
MTRTAPSEAAGTPAKEPATGAATRRLPLVLVTGLSGAGHTTALKTLEDIGYEAVDNLPLPLLDRLAEAGGSGIARPVAIGVDSRTRDFSAAALGEALDRLLADPTIAVRLLFLTAADEVIRRRFTETRRRHPLALDRPVEDGIRQERDLLEPVRARADLVVDTSELAIGDLRHLLTGHFALAERPAPTVTVMSFSYRRGLPREADLVFDTRFLANPHYEPALRALSGGDAAVQRFIEHDPGFAPFIASLENLVMPLLPRFEREGKSYLTIAVGCTGGRHRSVFVAERLAALLRGRGRQVSLRHRDVGLEEAVREAAPPGNAGRAAGSATRRD